MTQPLTATQVARAFEIADKAMFEVLLTDGIADDSVDTSFVALCNDQCQEVTTLAEASQGMRDAYAWLQERGYVELGTDPQGEHIFVLKRPGEDS